jgi:hypothetical protein
VTAVRPDGRTRTYLATDILPRGFVMPGRVGQVFAITPLTTPGRYAATVGWLDASGAPRNAVVFFREAGDGSIASDSVVAAPGARAIAAAPHDHVVVATLDPLRDGNTSLVTIVNASGNVPASWGRFDAPSVEAANDRIGGVRLYQIDRDTVAVYDAATQRVDAIRISAPEGGAILKASPSEKPRAMTAAADRDRFAVTELWTVPVHDTSDSGASEVLPVIGFAATADGVVTVVRPVVVQERPRTLVTRYTGKGRLPSWSSDRSWRAALVSPAEVRGIIAGATPWEERVTLARETVRP